ncbi:signal peptide peptidase SppA [Sphingomicrobium arenosum]|uniref:signal peptide peptidase SppA n=1 Tax=Sphingomicrobium arenosum TaxID=2233861 RepID=UPI002240D879|nr:signal peptide peptidase SppA [Sphingomicrobium arenosum]
MSFARSLWKLLVGIKDLLVLIFMLLFFGLLYVALRASPDPVLGDGVLLVDLDGSVVEEAQPADPFAELAGQPAIREWALPDVLAALKAAKEDDRVAAVALDLDGFMGGGQPAMEEIGEALDAIRAEGKTVTAFATGYVGDSYQLAAHADEVHLNPMGAVALAGPGGSQLYFAELLERLGVTANVYKVGTYKAAVEPFTERSMSEPARENMRALVEALGEQWRDDVKAARPAAQLDLVMDDPVSAFAGSSDLAARAVELGLVDQLSSRREWEARLAELGGADDDAPGGFKRIELADYIALETPREKGGEIAIVTVAGNIVDGSADPGTAAGESLVDALERAKERDYKALVVRIDSPGGSALASERIRNAILDLKAEQDIPVIASFGTYAASGGYWVATAADKIVAPTSTLTGSIGVFAVLPSFEGSLDKLGIGVDGVRTTPLSGEPDLLAGPSEAADTLFQAGVESTYAKFLAIVAEARGLPVERVATIAEGRVWDGGTARQLGLVDQYGGLDDAIALAAAEAGIEGEPSVHWIARELSFSAKLADMFGGANEEAPAPDAFARIAGRPDALMLRAVSTLEELLAGPTIQARCLECAPVTPPQAAETAATRSWLARVLFD